jgi:hypothetical protein
MLVTVTNTAGRDINVAQVGEDGIAFSGGEHPEEATHRSDPLPYPFSHIGTLASAGALQLPMHPADWRHKSVPSRAQFPWNQWNQLVQAGVVTVATAAQTDNVNVEEEYLGVV